MNRNWITMTLAGLLLGAVSAATAGCEVALLAGGMAQNWEYQKQIEVPPRYTGLEHKSVAVVVDADMATLFEHPDLIANITGGVAGRIRREVEGAEVLDARIVLMWKHRTPRWNAMPYGEIAESLNVDRVVFIDLYEYRLNPPGNRWEWEGVCAANVGIIERGSFAEDAFVDSFHVVGRFPTIKGVSRDDAPRNHIEHGVLSEFIKRTAWLFHEHLEPKYPDKFRAAR